MEHINPSFSSANTREYQYKANPIGIWIGIPLFGGGAYFFGNMALHNESGLIIDSGLIRLDSAGATNFYWGLAALAGLVLLIGLIAWVSPKTIRLDDQAITLPHGWLGPFVMSQTIRVQYSDIKGIYERQYRYTTSLVLSTKSANYLINASLLPEPAAYDSIKNFIAARIRSM